jgi:chromosome segregation ATPase
MMGGVTVAGGNEFSSLLEVMSDPDKYKRLLASLQDVKEASDEAAAKLAEGVAAARKEHDAQLKELTAAKAAADKSLAAATERLHDAGVAESRLSSETSRAKEDLAHREASVAERENEAKSTRDGFKRVSQELIKQKQELDAREKNLDEREEHLHRQTSATIELKAEYEDKLAKLRALL